MCDAPFKMTRGCLLEKRCPACRIFGVSSRTDEPFYKERHRVFTKPEGSTYRINCFYPQEQTLKLLYDDAVLKESSNDIMDEIINDDASEHIEKVLEENLKPREIKALMMHIDEYDLIEIGNELGVTRERARQIVSSAIKQLKHPMIGRQLLACGYQRK